ncbi:MAG: tRNA pseudouridine(38-40) synthase TruA [Bacteroidetes bacterium]|nr:tRNA pseudouridine(38-40) synthase TruA [Bacteroidota bacterium]MBU1717653.1 tRNA pseudouridine(38-40) synthase TruA [Bacteroidota bacterium]
MQHSQRYFVQLSYDGTAYHGWQSQPNAITVQTELESCFTRVLGREIALTGCGRTDTGVHAREYFAHFDFHQPQKISSLLTKANKMIPADIAIQHIFQVTDDAHARFSATNRTYRYYVNCEKSPFDEKYSLFYHGSLNVNEMNRAAGLLMKYSDFTSFAKLHSGAENNICEVREAFWKKNGTQLVFTITANRFLRNMVRAITGSLLDIGRGKINVDDFVGIIQARNRNLAGMSAKAKGLFLEKITYPDSIFLTGK